MSLPTMTENDRVLEALQRLEVSLKGLSDKTPPPVLSHYRTSPPEATTSALSLVRDAATKLQATVTKYTLIGKIDLQENEKLAPQLLEACQVLATGAVVLHDDSQCGTCTALKSQIKMAVRTAVAHCMALVKVFAGSNCIQKDDPVPAQKTGAVWEACTNILTKLPSNNRNAMRRHVFTYLTECRDTLDEFSQLLELEEDNERDASGEDTTWDMFMAGQSDAYSEREQVVVVPSLALIKCTRGSLQVTLQACDGIVATNDDNESDVALAWIAKLYAQACIVGEGMTDLGSVLYAPLDMEEVEEQVEEQSEALVTLLDMVLEQELPSDAIKLATKIRAAVDKRREEAMAAIAEA